jgi:hypothetical protein
VGNSGTRCSNITVANYKTPFVVGNPNNILILLGSASKRRKTECGLTRKGVYTGINKNCDEE